MQFELTPEVIDQIIFAMENQESGFSFDTQSSTVIQDLALPEEDPERYVAIPDWGSADGFHLMEKFVVSLRNPIAREKLRSALASGKGVFRSFKNALKEQEGIEKLWFSFKDRELKHRVTEWYNDLCEAWGWERIAPEPEEDETGELVLSDFEVGLATGERLDLVRNLDREAYIEAFAGLPRVVVEERFRLSRSGLDPAGERSVVLGALTPGKDLAGFVWAVEELYDSDLRRESRSSGHLRLLRVIQLYVLSEYRGLGIAKALIGHLCGIAAERGAWSLSIDLSGSGEVLLNHLEAMGFTVASRSLALDVEKWAEEQADE